MTILFNLQIPAKLKFFAGLKKVPLFMKITFFLLFLSVGISFAAPSYAQNTSLSLKMNSATVAEILDAIEKQTEFRFYYNSKLVDTERETSIAVKDDNVFTTLDKLFAGTDVSYKVIDKDIILTAKGQDQSDKKSASDKTVNGIVTDMKGETLIGVNVSIKGTSAGAITDAGGKYTLEQVSDQSILVFSYIGYVSQEVKVGNQRTINIRLEEDLQNLNEVVVVGYGTQKKATLTGAVAYINSGELTTTKTDNVLTNMSGKIPGLLIRQQTGEPGDFSNLVSIRGYGNPVVVIDGVVRNQNGLADLAQINSDDIEQISVLKDASAAIYGMSAANGVIIVTTKKGEAAKTRISYSGTLSVKMPTSMPEMMSAYEYRLFANEFQRNVKLPPAYSDDILEKFKNGEPGYTDWDWLAMCFRKSVTAQNHTLSVRGGNNKVRHFTSFSYNDDNGLYKSGMEYYKRWTGRSNLTADLTNDLKMNVLISGRMDKYRRSPGPFIYDYKNLITNDRGVGPYTLDNPTHLTNIPPQSQNPMAVCDPNIGSDLYENLTGTSQIDFTYKIPFVKGLSLNALGSLDIKTGNQSSRRNSWDMFDYISGAYVSTVGANSYQNTINLYQKGYGKFQANYENKFGDHSLTLLAAVEAAQERFDNLSGTRQFPDIFTFPTINAGATTTATNSGYREWRRYAAFISRLNYDYRGKYLVEAMVRYDGNYRYAPSKRWVWFPSVSLGWRVSEENFFKKNISFINNLKLRASYGESGLDAGNPYEYVAAYTSDNYRGYIFSDGKLTAGMYPPGVVNDNLTWITAKFSNFGADIDFLKSKLSLTIEYFERRNTGMLSSKIATAPNFFGASFPQENLNSDLNRGLDFLLRFRGKIGEDFKYSVGANVTFARTKRLHIERGPFTSEWDIWQNGNTNRYTGRNLIYIYNGQYTSLAEYETAPLLGGALGNTRMLPGSFKIIDVNGDGKIDANDQVYKNWSYGNVGYVSSTSGNFDQKVNPPLQYGFPIEAAYKSFDLNLLFQGAALYSVNYANYDIWGYGRYPNLNVKYRDRWHTQNSTDGNGNIIYANPFDPATVWIPGKYPAGRPYNYDNTTDSGQTYPIDVWRPMANYLRLKNIELGYTVPQKALKKAGIENVRIFVNGTNLLLFCKKELKQADPEKQEGDWNANLSYPIMKQVNFGINLNF